MVSGFPWCGHIFPFVEQFLLVKGPYRPRPHLSLSFPPSFNGDHSGLSVPHADLHSSFSELSLQKDSQTTKERNYFVPTIRKLALWVLSGQIVQQIGEGHTVFQNVCTVSVKYCLHTFSSWAISQQTMASRDKLHHKGWIPAVSGQMSGACPEECRKGISYINGFQGS